MKSGMTYANLSILMLLEQKQFDYYLTQKIISELKVKA